MNQFGITGIEKPLKLAGEEGKGLDNAFGVRISCPRSRPLQIEEARNFRVTFGEDSTLACQVLKFLLIIESV